MPRALLIFCILSTLSFAQDAATGALHGTVLDPSGSRIPQTSIVAVNSATGARYSATSDAESRFSLDISLPATTPPAPSLKACRRKSVRHFTSKSAPHRTRVPSHHRRRSGKSYRRSSTRQHRFHCNSATPSTFSTTTISASPSPPTASPPKPQPSLHTPPTSRSPLPRLLPAAPEFPETQRRLRPPPTPARPEIHLLKASWILKSPCGF